MASNGARSSDWWCIEKCGQEEILHYHQLYADKSDPVCLPIYCCEHSGPRVRLLFLHAHREASALAGELPEESDRFRFLYAACLATPPNLTGSVGLILAKASEVRITIPLDLSTRPFIPLPRFFHSRRTPPLLNPSLVLFPQRSA